MASRIFAAVLEQDPEHVEALAGLADASFETGNLEQAQSLLEQVPDSGKDKPAVAAVRAKITLAEQTAGLGNQAELEHRLAADPSDHQARFDLALILNAREQREEAADQLLMIIKADRNWQEEAARNQLLQFFEAWGVGDPASLAARRKLSSVLFS